ncbi:hypothetical protein B0T24DRAFT_275487 [Lasiosphaeria ovina]|uniref:Fe2OG dioxygenase domain-containing protein n=1 Tax=Lasiosphaeria ovina TaxID=92902 RepID=A0AAE0KBR5_9PEZI|nr:hypothetical protein B0T24DRAFT_275487 [Lasiosphaeria ovina]
MANVAKIPVIDISGGGGEAEQLQVAKELVEAAIEHGFVFIRNTGNDIPVEAVEGAFDISRKLFGAPLEEKEKCKYEQNNRGWSSMQYEVLDPKNQRVSSLQNSLRGWLLLSLTQTTCPGWRLQGVCIPLILSHLALATSLQPVIYRIRAFNFGEFVDGKAQQPIPDTIAQYEGQVGAFRDLCYQMCLKINTLLGIGLQVDPPDFFTAAHLREKGTSGTILRFLYYPPLADTSADREDVRAGAHSDYGSITMLFRLKGQAGLEILTREDTWAPVPVTPPGTEGDAAPPILVNIGDLLSYWTNGLLRSTVHRVVFPGPGKGAVEGETDADPRYSMAFFCHPVGTTPLTPVPSERVRQFKAPPSSSSQAAQLDPAGEKVLTADEHLNMRLRASYLQFYKDKE